MNLKFYEKLIISIIVFIGVVIVTAFIIGNYVRIKNDNKQNNANNNRIILENINLF